MTILDLLLIILGVGVTIAVLINFTKDSGCSGDCYQGRRPCNCKGKK